MKAWASLLLFAFGCGPPCRTVGSAAPVEVCRAPDAGAITAGTPFVLMGSTTLVSASCSVFVDGGQLDFVMTGTGCSSGVGFAKPPVAQHVRCEVPAVPAGTYRVNSEAPLTFAVPESADAGLPSCP